MMLLQKLKWHICTLALFLGLGCISSGVAQDNTPLYEENALYVKFKDQSAISAKKMLRNKNGEKNIKTALLGLPERLVTRYKIQPEAISMSLFDNPVLDKTFLILTDPNAKADLDQLIEELEKNPDIEYVERVPLNLIFDADSPEKPVNDPFFGNVSSKNINVSWHLDLINAEKAWEIQTGDSNIIVAVVDNAIWGEHEDLQIPSERQYNCVTRVRGNSAPPVSQTVQDAQCEIPDIYNGSCTAYDFSHGTHCAGAIAAINNNGTGIASIGSGLTLMGVGGPNLQNPTAIYQSYHGVEWAIEHGANVISCSWGSDVSSITNETIMKTCYERGIIVIAAAGNDNISTPHYPAAYTPYVISVGSVDANQKKSSFSNYGYWVDVLSPGGYDTTAYQTMIFSTTFCQNQYSRLFGEIEEFTGKYYDEMSGTSMATPILAGIVGLMLSYDSTLTTDQIRLILQNTGHNVADSNYLRYNSYCKIADAYKALDFLKSNPVFGPKLPKINLTAETAHDSVWLTWQAPETEEAIKGYRIYRNGTVIADNYQTLSFLDTNRTAGTLRYALEPLFEDESLYSVRTEIDVTIKNYYTVSALIRPDTSCGSVEGVGEYELRQIFTLTAIPAEGYVFDYWMDESATPLYGTTLSGPTLKNRRFFAYFKEGTHNEEFEKFENALTITPNPASEEISIQCPDCELLHIRITDMQGRTVYNADCKTYSQTIAIGSWQKGTYMVQVTTQAGTVNRKMIKR